MNIVEKLHSLGIQTLEFKLNSQQQKFVLSRDAGAYDEFLYMMKNSTVPSSSEIQFSKTRTDELLKDFVDDGFKLVFVRASYGRWISNQVFLYHEEHNILVRTGESVQTTLNIPGLDKYAGEEDEEDKSSFCFCHQVDKNFDLIKKYKDKYFCSDILTDKGKILLFEKNEYNDIVLNPYPIKNYDLNIGENYNDDFLEVHNKLTGWASDFKSRNNKLVLLHGEPGSGKTNYIKYILNNIADVKKIYIPPYLVNSIADPTFLPIIKKEKESILIIEDAEKILINREDASNNSIISILLNLCDGIMADVLNFKIIATFNTDEDKIDSALKRKGRMFLKYRFDSLSEEKTKALFEKVHGEPPPKKRMTLAEIYNDENNFGEKKKEKGTIGFANFQ